MLSLKPSDDFSIKVMNTRVSDSLADFKCYTGLVTLDELCSESGEAGKRRAKV
ncbi:MAG: hypothetical protein ACJ703_05185 [Nitrososphaera sp.]